MHRAADYGLRHLIVIRVLNVRIRAHSPTGERGAACRHRATLARSRARRWRRPGRRRRARGSDGAGHDPLLCAGVVHHQNAIRVRRRLLVDHSHKAPAGVVVQPKSRVRTAGVAVFLRVAGGKLCRSRLDAGTGVVPAVAHHEVQPVLRGPALRTVEWGNGTIYRNAHLLESRARSGLDARRGRRYRSRRRGWLRRGRCCR